MFKFFHMNGWLWVRLPQFRCYSSIGVCGICVWHQDSPHIINHYSNRPAKSAAGWRAYFSLFCLSAQTRPLSHGGLPAARKWSIKRSSYWPHHTACLFFYDALLCLGIAFFVLTSAQQQVKLCNFNNYYVHTEKCIVKTTML